MVTKNINIALFVIMIFGILFAGNNPRSYAESQIVEAEGVYVADMKIKETMEAITEHAREDAMRRASEHAKIYVQSYSEANNFKLSKDRILVITASIMKVLDDNAQIASSNADYFKVVCKIKAEVDTSKIDPDKILANENMYQIMNEKDALIERLLEENRKLKALAAQATSESQLQEIQDKFDINQRNFLIAKYERDLNIYDFDGDINWQSMLDLAKKLAELDPPNPTAFRAKIYYYREHGDWKKVMDFSSEMLKTNPPIDTTIEAFTQLGDVYYNGWQDKDRALRCINQAIMHVKDNYNQKMIDELVNGTNVQVRYLSLAGKSNTIRELYILKSELENCNPTFKAKSVIKGTELVEDTIFDLKYKTDW